MTYQVYEFLRAHIPNLSLYLAENDRWFPTRPIIEKSLVMVVRKGHCFMVDNTVL